MHFTISLTLLLTALSHAAALPTPELTPRSCSRLDPYVLRSYTSAHPTTNAVRTVVSKSGGAGAGSITGRTVIGFNGIPPGAQGCLLHFALPGNNHQFATGDAGTVNVFGADRAPSRSTNWNNQPRKLQQYSSFNVPSPRGLPVDTILLSVPCDKAAKGFVMEPGNWQQHAGTVSVPQHPKSSGFFLTYDC